jgi:hypothetical protein
VAKHVEEMLADVGGQGERRLVVTRASMVGLDFFREHDFEH